MYYNHNPFEGDNGWHEKELGEGYHVQGYMTSSSRCKLQLKIWKEADKDMPSQMYSQEPFEGDNGWHEEEIGEGYHVEGIMTSSSRCNCCFERQRLIRLIERVAPSFRHRKIVPSSLPKANWTLLINTLHLYKYKSLLTYSNFTACRYFQYSRITASSTFTELSTKCSP